MTPRGRFFQKAELDSNWPFQFLIIVFGVVLAMFEGGLALWPVCLLYTSDAADD